MRLFREESVKHFRLSDGSYIAAQYNSPVHTLDENGVWQDIDNSLSKSGSEFSNPTARIKFAKKITGNSTLFSLHDGNDKITLSLIGANKGTVGTVTNGSDAEEDTELQKMMNLEKLSSSIVYKDILDGVDLEYVAHSNNVKENIIVKTKRDSYSFSFEFKLNGLTPTLTSSGDIEICNDGGEIKYLIPALIVFDAAGIYAPKDAARYILTYENGKKYTLTVAVSSEWMNSEERVFPVTVDPTITDYNAVIADTYIDSSNPSTDASASNTLEVGEGKIAYWKSNQLPVIPMNANITEATLAVTIVNVSLDASYVGVYDVVSGWDPSISWNEYTQEGEGQLSELPSDYLVMSKNSNTSTYVFNITDIVAKWYLGTEGRFVLHNGVAFAKIPGYNANVQLYSNDYANARPILSITYLDMKGIESYWSYTSHSVGTAGDGTINLANGNLVFAIPTLTSTDYLFGFTPTLVYNSSIAHEKYIQRVNLRTAYQNPALGNGFKLNACETLIEIKIYLNENYSEWYRYFVYADADGTEHELYPVEYNAVAEITEGEEAEEPPKSSIFADTEGLGFVLIEEADAIYLTDDSKSVKTFRKMSYPTTVLVDSNWYLSEIEDKYGNVLAFDVDADYRPVVVKIKPVGATTATTMLRLLYTTDGMLCAVYNPSSKHSVVLKYSETYSNTAVSYLNRNYVRSVIRCYGNEATTEADVLSFATSSGGNSNVIAYDSSTYYYDANGRLTEVFEQSTSKSIRYTWDAACVTKISEYACDQLGQELGINYYLNATEIRTTGNDEELNTSDDILNRYVFDNYGRVIYVYSCSVDESIIYGATLGEYDNDEESKNSLKEKIVLSNMNPNLLLNGEFAKSYYSSDTISHWTVNGSVSRLLGDSISHNDLLFLSVSPTAQGETSISQTVTLGEGKYSFSLHYDSTKCSGVIGKVEFIDAATSVVLHSDSLNLNTANSERREVLYTDFAIDSETNVTVKISFTASGSVASNISLKIGKAKLEKGDLFSEYTPINAGSFDVALNAASKWSASSGNVIIHTDEETGESYLQLNANGGVNYAKQSIVNKTLLELREYNNIFVPYNNNHQFLISGFAKAEKPLHNKEFRIYLEIEYYYGSNENIRTVTYPVDFADISNEWQSVSGMVTISKDKYGNDLPVYQCIKSVSIVCDYSNQLFGKVYFDNITLTYVGEEKVQKNEYDDGLVTRVVNGLSETYYSYYDDRNVKRIANNKGTLIDYYYVAGTEIVDHTIEYEYTYNGSSTEYPYNKSNPDNYIVKTPKSRTQYTYNQYGMVTEVRTYETSTGENYTMGDKFSLQTYTYDVTPGSKIFGALLSEQNSKQDLRYFYDSNTGWMLATVNANSRQGTSYVYDASGKLLTVSPAMYLSTSTGYLTHLTDASVNYRYDVANRLESITTYSTEYTFNYDIFGNSDSINVGTLTLAEYEYYSHNGKLKCVIYGNGYAVEYIYNGIEALSKVKYRLNADSPFITAYEYEYNTDGQIRLMRDFVNDRVTVYKYDAQRKLVGYEEYKVSDYERIIDTSVSYDDDLRVSAVTSVIYYVLNESILAESLTNSYTYLDDGRIEKYTVGNDLFETNVIYTYDSLDRIIGISYNVDEELYITESFGYSSSTQYGEELFIGFYNSTVGADTITYTYTYNSNGNVVEIQYSNGKVITYSYDSLGQLITEDNGVTGYCYTYNYDRAGNLTSTVKAPQGSSGNGEVGLTDIESGVGVYALKPGLPIVTTVTNTYTYSSSEWGDLLTSFNGVSITYDAIGNPESYYNGSSYTFEWRGRQLIGATKGSNTMVFAYNSDGLRISKTVNGATTHYIYNGSLLIAEYTNTEAIVYIYDANGSPIGFEYTYMADNGAVSELYWYAKNLQGDIVSVYSDAGTKLVTYNYNAWGVTTKTYHNGGASTKAVKNNLTYRGYYYDADLEMYYLQSRYYDPVICRFISSDVADVLTATSDALTDKNLYAYCDNNPVMRVDHNGEFWLELGIMITGGAIGATVNVIASYAAEALTSDKPKLKTLLVAAASGFVSGAISSSSLGRAGQIVAGAITGGLSYIADTHVRGQQISCDDFLLSTTLGAVSGAIGGDGLDYCCDISLNIINIKLSRSLSTLDLVSAETVKNLTLISAKLCVELEKEIISATVKFAIGSAISNFASATYKKLKDYLQK